MTSSHQEHTQDEKSQTQGGSGHHRSGRRKKKDMSKKINISNVLRGKRILVTGVTGFLGKVYVSMLLTNHPDIDQLYLVIRATSYDAARDRFYKEVAASPPFNPIREREGKYFQEWLEKKVTIVNGDTTKSYLGLPLKEAEELSSKLDLFVNSAGLTNFNPNLRNAIEINTLSQLKTIEFVRLGGSRAKIFHVSTAYVAGRTEGESDEEIPNETRYPSYDDLEAPYDPEREIADCMAMIEHTEAKAEDQERTTLFAKLARETIVKENINPDDDIRRQQVFDKEKKKWIRDELSRLGRQRADHWGYVNIYTYSKSLGERLLAKKCREIDYVIFRPTIIESSAVFPFPGWNEGVNTTSPIIFLSYKGHRFIPTRDDVDLDIIPVDYVVGAMLSICAALLEGSADHVYHCGSSDLAPLSVKRLIELTTLGTRKLYDKRAKMPTWQRIILKSIDSVPVSPKQFERHSAPRLTRVSKRISKAISKLPTKHMGGIGKALDVVKSTAEQTEKIGVLNEKIFELFLPFIYENKYTFQMDHFVDLRGRLEGAPDEELYLCKIENLDWRDYWVNVHVPGLDKYAFDEMERKFRAKKKSAYTYDDLRELFESTTRNYPDHIAYQHHHGTIVETYTYAEVRERSLRVADILVNHGFTAGSSALLVSENRPQWGMTYFGIIHAGGVAVPVDPDSSEGQILNVVASSGASVIIASDKVLERIGENLALQLELANFKTLVLPLQSFFRLGLPAPSDVDCGVTTVEASNVGEIPAGRVLETKGHNIASLIFTSGTTGTPKGVLLSHRNFTALIHSLESMFTITEKDGFLSILPLHHTFEFSAGFLMPFSKGSTVTYLEELTAEELQNALKSTHISAMIGVPALWQLLYRRIQNKVNSQNSVVQWVFKTFKRFNHELRERTGLNFGPTLFAGIHAAFGRRIRYMISGGASLPKELMDAYYSFGFNLYEGYGLTEAAPVLTANSPSNGLLPGSVGKPLEGVEIKIDNPNKDGVGEVLARGENVMVGYLDREDLTEQALQDGWLRTGDLGKIDRKGNLTIMGRSKECIVTSGGKNVYPDELEDFYGDAPKVQQFSIFGLPDRSGSERVAAIFRIDPDSYETEAEYEERCEDVRAYLKVQGSRTASYNRLLTVRFTKDELPTTSTRKVKRAEVARIFQKMLDEEATNRSDDSALEQANWGWLDTEIAGLAGVDLESVSFATHFQDDLGFDSLMVAELNTTLENNGYDTTIEALTPIETVGELRAYLSSLKDGGSKEGTKRPKRTDVERSQPEIVTEIEEYDVPAFLRSPIRSLLAGAQEAIYRDLYDVEVYGRAFIPKHNPNIIVVANHSSHLDMGVVKYALGDFGKNIKALAAADYFFSNSVRKTYFNQFTNLIPLERSGSLEKSLGPACDALREGEMLLMFPEGTRSTDGKLRPFRKGLGYLVATHKVDILPIWIHGTHRALPKGQNFPSLTSRKFTVRIGKTLTSIDLLKKFKELKGSELYAAIANEAHDVIAELSTYGLTHNSGEDLERLFTELEGRFTPDQIDQKIVYYWTLGASEDSKWTVVVDRDYCSIHKGKPRHQNADCVIKTTPEIFKKIVCDQYIPSFDEFISGVIKTNAPELLMQFPNVFDLQSDD